MSIFRAIDSDAKYGKVSVGIAATELKVGTAMIPGRTGLMIANNEETAAVYIGTDDDVTTANGFSISPGEHVFLKLVPGQQIFAIGASGTLDIRIIEIH